MKRALEADGEKLRQLTGEDHGPKFIVELTLEEQINDLSDRMAEIRDGDKVNPRAWRTLLIYVPHWLLKERVSSRRNGVDEIVKLRAMLARWLRIAESHNFRDSTQLNLGVHPLTDETRTMLARSDDE